MKNNALCLVVALLLTFPASASDETALVPVSCQGLLTLPLSIRALMAPKDANDPDAQRKMEIRVALAEFIHIARADIEPAHLKAWERVVAGELDPITDPSLQQYRALFEQMVNDSLSVDRMNAEQIDTERNDNQVDLAMVIAKKNSIFLSQKKKSFRDKVASAFGKKPPIEFKLTSVFNNHLRGIPAKNRLRALRLALRNMPSLTLHEAFYIASAFEGYRQAEAMGLLSRKISTPVSMFPMEAVLDMSSVLNPWVRQEFLRRQKYSISKEEFIRLAGENPALLQRIKDAGVSMGAIVFSKKEIIDYSMTNPELLKKVKDYGVSIEAFDAKDLNGVLKIFAASEKPVSFEQTEVLVAVVYSIKGKLNKVDAIYQITQSLKFSEDGMILLGKARDAVKRGPEVSVEEIIRTAYASRNSLVGDRILVEYAKKNHDLLSPEDIIRLSGCAYYQGPNAWIIWEYAKRKFDQLSVDEAVLLSNKAIWIVSIDGIVLGVAKKQKAKHSPADFQALANAAYSGRAKNSILKLVND